MNTESKFQTNVEFVTDLMEYSNYGGLVQAFVIEAIHSYAKYVSEAEPVQQENQFINPVAWQGVAKEVLEKVETKYKTV